MCNEQRAIGDGRRPEDSPAVWFVVLERARRTNDFELAAHARRELERLGVKVTYKSARAYQTGGKRVDHE
jgi:hypothetical protein